MPTATGWPKMFIAATIIFVIKLVLNRSIIAYITIRKRIQRRVRRKQ